MRKSNGDYDVVVPAGGGKDSSYVAWTLKHKYNMNPLCVFCEPPLFTKIGEENLLNFKSNLFLTYPVTIKLSGQRSWTQVMSLILKINLRKAPI